MLCFVMWLQLHSVLWVGGASCLYTLTSSGLNKWELDDTWEQHVLRWDTQRALTESIADAIWVSVSALCDRQSKKWNNKMLFTESLVLS